MKIAMRNLAVIAIVAAASAIHAGESQTILLPQKEEIPLALQAAPPHLRAEATVYVFGKDGYRKVRSGKNGFVCLVNRDGNQAGDNQLKPTCWDAEGSRTIVPVVLRVGELIARSTSQEEIKRDIDDGFTSGKFSSPQKTGIAYMLLGDLLFDPRTQNITKTAFPPHYMIYAPGVSSADIGMTTQTGKSQFALPTVYAGCSGGTRTAYIIVLATAGTGHTH